ncbi:MAG: OmpA family protein [Paracoccaceae bacterium]
MGNVVRQSFRAMLVVGGLGLAVAAGTARADDALLTGPKDEYVPTIWVDPDGCEHWVMDDGQRGFMDIRLDRRGNPICNRALSCADMPADQLFASGSAAITAPGKAALDSFFRSGRAASYAISGHTDGDGGTEANMRLSEARADAVAAIAKAAGAKVTSVAGYGETKPVAPNATAAGKAKNRRVEIFCGY